MKEHDLISSKYLSAGIVYRVLNLRIAALRFELSLGCFFGSVHPDHPYFELD